MFYRVQRGMVFWFNPEKAYGTTGTFNSPDGHVYPTHIIRGNRPYVVVGYTGTSQTCTVAAITSSDKSTNPCAVRVSIPCSKYETSTVLVDQVKTVDVKALDDFICVLSEDDMQEIYAVLAAHMGISPEPVLMDSVIERLESTVERIISSRVKSLKMTATEEDIDNAALRLGVALEELLTPSTPTSVQSEVDMPSKKKGQTWTAEQCKEFLEEYKHSSAKEMQVKWGLPSTQAVYSAASRCRKRLKKGQ